MYTKEKNFMKGLCADYIEELIAKVGWSDIQKEMITKRFLQFKTGSLKKISLKEIAEILRRPAGYESHLVTFAGRKRTAGKSRTVIARIAYFKDPGTGLRLHFRGITGVQRTGNRRS